MKRRSGSIIDPSSEKDAALKKHASDLFRTLLPLLSLLRLSSSSRDREKRNC